MLFAFPGHSNTIVLKENSDTLWRFAEGNFPLLVAPDAVKDGVGKQVREYPEIEWVRMDFKI